MTIRQSISRRGFLANTAGLGATVLVGPLAANLSGQPGGATPSDDGPWQIGCYTRPWDQFDYRQALDAIAEAGFKYVGLMTTKSPSRVVLGVKDTLEAAARVKEEIKKRGLKMTSFWGGGIIAPDRQKTAANLRHLIDLCEVVEGKNVLLGGIGRDEQYDTYFGAVADCCDYAADKKIGLDIKPHGGLNATGPQLRQTAKKVNHKNFGIYYDPGNIFHYSKGEINPVDDVSAVDGLVRGLVIKDFRLPPDDGDVWVTPGTGKVDFAAVFANLKKGGFSGGPLLVETLSRGDLPHLLAEAKNTRRFLENLVRG